MVDELGTIEIVHSLTVDMQLEIVSKTGEPFNKNALGSVALIEKR